MQKVLSIDGRIIPAMVLTEMRRALVLQTQAREGQEQGGGQLPHEGRS